MITPTITSGGKASILKAIKAQGHVWVAGHDMKIAVRKMAESGQVEYHAQAIMNGARCREEYYVTLKNNA